MFMNFRKLLLSKRLVRSKFVQMLEIIHMQFIGGKIGKYLFKTSNKDTRTAPLCSVIFIVDLKRYLPIVVSGNKYV